MSEFWSEDVISAYLDNQLTSHQRKQVETHLKNNPRDAEALREYQQLRIDIRHAPRYKLDNQFSDRVVRAIGKATPATDPAEAESALDQPKIIKKGSDAVSWRAAASTIAALAATVLMVILLVPVARVTDTVAQPDPSEEFAEGDESISADSSTRPPTSGQPAFDYMEQLDSSGEGLEIASVESSQKIAGSEIAAGAKMDAPVGDTQDSANQFRGRAQIAWKGRDGKSLANPNLANSKPANSKLAEAEKKLPNPYAPVPVSPPMPSEKEGQNEYRFADRQSKFAAPEIMSGGENQTGQIMVVETSETKLNQQALSKLLGLENQLADVSRSPALNDAFEKMPQHYQLQQDLEHPQKSKESGKRSDDGEEFKSLVPNEQLNQLMLIKINATETQFEEILSQLGGNQQVLMEGLKSSDLSGKAAATLGRKPGGATAESEESRGDQKQLGAQQQVNANEESDAQRRSNTDVGIGRRGGQREEQSKASAGGGRFAGGGGFGGGSEGQIVQQTREGKKNEIETELAIISRAYLVPRDQISNKYKTVEDTGRTLFDDQLKQLSDQRSKQESLNRATDMSSGDDSEKPAARARKSGVTSKDAKSSKPKPADADKSQFEQLDEFAQRTEEAKKKEDQAKNAPPSAAKAGEKSLSKKSETPRRQSDPTSIERSVRRGVPSRMLQEQREARNVYSILIRILPSDGSQLKQAASGDTPPAAKPTDAKSHDK